MANDSDFSLGGSVSTKDEARGSRIETGLMYVNVVMSAKGYAGIGMTRKHGTCVLVGISPGEFPTPLFDVVANCITIRG